MLTVSPVEVLKCHASSDSRYRSRLPRYSKRMTHPILYPTGLTCRQSQGTLGEAADGKLEGRGGLTARWRSTVTCATSEKTVQGSPQTPGVGEPTNATECFRKGRFLRGSRSTHSEETATTSGALYPSPTRPRTRNVRRDTGPDTQDYTAGLSIEPSPAPQSSMLSSSGEKGNNDSMAQPATTTTKPLAVTGTKNLQRWMENCDASAQLLGSDSTPSPWGTTATSGRRASAPTSTPSSLPGYLGEEKANLAGEKREKIPFRKSSPARTAQSCWDEGGDTIAHIASVGGETARQNGVQCGVEGASKSDAQEDRIEKEEVATCLAPGGWGEFSTGRSKWCLLSKPYLTDLIRLRGTELVVANIAEHIWKRTVRYGRLERHCIADLRRT